MVMVHVCKAIGRARGVMNLAGAEYEDHIRWALLLDNIKEIPRYAVMRVVMLEKWSVAISFAALLAEASLLEQYASFQFVAFLLVCYVLQMVRLEGFPVYLTQWDIVLLIEILLSRAIIVP